MIRRVFPLLFLFLMASMHGDRPRSDRSDDPLATFELHPDFQIELIASEPLVADPIDMEIDEYGRLFVLEFHSYPDNWTGADRIKMLRDTDGDGAMDESVIFADSLVQAMGIMRWKEGLIVTAPPNVIYLEDSDGDGRADVHRVVLSGFHQGDGEGDVNNPTYGLDNWIYLGNRRHSDEGIFFAARPDGPRVPPEATTRNVRFRPDTFELEAQSSDTQYGFTFDRWGHQLLNHNRNHVYQEIVAARYLARNPDLLVARASESISDHGAATKVFPITENPAYQILTDVGEITSACGITFYDGGLFPDDFREVSFVAEPAHNLVHADRLRRTGPALTASRIRPHDEFLASTDPSFRPVNMYVGPDGAVYVVDYYRKIIEGPEWIADEVLATGTLYEGTDMGRIYRITPQGTGPANWTAGVKLGNVSNAELVRHLSSPNIWWRRGAQRLLMDRNATDAVPALEAAARDAPPVGRLHALWTLEGLGRLDGELIVDALNNGEPGLRENAVRLAERHLDENLEEPLLSMASDPDEMVRFQLLLTLGALDTPGAAEVREELLFRDIDNEWMQVAALSAPSVQKSDLLEKLIRSYEPAQASFVQRLSALAGIHLSPDRIQTLLDDAAAPGSDGSWRAPVLEGLAQGLDRRDDVSDSLDLSRVFVAFFDHPSASVRAAALNVLKATGLPSSSEHAVQRAARTAADADVPAESRVQAIELLTLDDPARHVSMLTDRIDPGEPAAVQAAAVRALGGLEGTGVSEITLERWPVLTSEVRDAALDAILRRPFDLDRVEQLLDALENGNVRPDNIGWGHRVILMRDIPVDMKNRARALITGPEEQIRQETAEYVRLVQEKTPHAAQGRAVFHQACARCHGLGDVASGGNVGPDLMSVRGWTAADIIDNIVRPHESITRGYELWQITLEGGETIEGMIAAETANAVTVRDENGEESTYARRAIRSLTELDASIMPSDFAETLSHQEMADLVAFIRVGD